MTRGYIALISVLALAAPAAAGTRDFTAAVETLRARIKSEAEGFSSAAALSRGERQTQGLLSGVLEAMSGGKTGKTIIDWLRTHKAVVEFDDRTGGKMSARSWAYVGEGETAKPAVYIHPVLSERETRPEIYLAVLVAKESAEHMLLDFPESAEKRVMAGALVSEVYFEQGGMEEDLPAFGAMKDEALAKTIRLWIEKSPKSGVKTLRKEGKPSLDDIQESLWRSLDSLQRSKGEAMLLGALTRDPWRGAGYGVRAGHLNEWIKSIKKRLAGLKAARKRFKSFRKYEKSWRSSRDR